MMRANDDMLPIRCEPDIAERAADLKVRLLESEPMTMQNLADALGLDFELVSAAVAIAHVLKTGQGVTIDPAPAPKVN